ncbi:MAG: Adenylate kinase [Parcubacteria group bacterium GW2011_GWA1_47_8]|nr:MAG: Adenylate kinase [Parcubacteria group bacterium GW2011_GWA1_47_8]
MGKPCYASCMDLQTIIFLGRSGSGKGTQARLLKQFFLEHAPETPVLHIETGAHFRKYLKEPGYTWDLARRVGEQGLLQPNFLAVWVWVSEFVGKLVGNEHVIFDGAPRTLSEAKILNGALSFYKRPNITIIFLNVSRDWAEDRLKIRGRADDVSTDVIHHRLAWYEEEVAPAIEFYRGQTEYRFLEVSGEQAPEKVFGDISKQLTTDN